MSAFITNPITSALKNYNTKIIRGRKYKGFLPSFNPVITSLSTNFSIPGEYTLVYVTGENFLPNGVTYIQFGGYKNIPITYYSSFYISFLIPLDTVGGRHQVYAVNIYNGNFSPQVNYSYPGTLNYSNPFEYTLLTFRLTGSYQITSNEDFNTVITFTGNGDIFFYSTKYVEFVIVGGGGGGAGGTLNGTGGGGGGGGQVNASFFVVASKTNYSITVGEGGLGGKGGTTIDNAGLDGSPGSTSSISKFIAYTSYGGGGGYGSSDNITNGDGGQTGGGIYGGDGNKNPGGYGINGSGGGGGELAANGGDGATFNTALPFYDKSFGAGGGGGAGKDGTNNGIGGNIYAGSGGNKNNGVANYGAGGGGGQGGDETTIGSGGNGGSGVVVLLLNI